MNVTFSGLLRMTAGGLEKPFAEQRDPRDTTRSTFTRVSHQLL